MGKISFFGVSFLLASCMVLPLASWVEVSADPSPPFQVKITPWKKVYRPGENVFFEIRIENSSDRTWSLPNRVNHYLLRHGLLPSGDELCFDDMVSETISGDSKACVTLEPGYFYGVTKEVLTTFSTEGEYKFWVTYHGPKTDKIPEIWCGKVKSNVVTFTVRERQRSQRNDLPVGAFPRAEAQAQTMFASTASLMRQAPER